MSIGERIQLARNERGYSQSQLATMVGVSRGACGQWERNISSPSIENLSMLAVMLDVAFEWLATGRGDKSAETRVSEPAAKYELPVGLSEGQRELLAAYSRLTEPQRHALTKLLEVL